MMNSINALLPRTTLILRDGHWARGEVSSLVPGDIVSLRYGDKVPADLRLVRVSDLSLDKSILTGEVEPVDCTIDPTDLGNYLESRNIALMGTLVTDGEGVGVVVATGDRTVMGKITLSIGRDNVESLGKSKEEEEEEEEAVEEEEEREEREEKGSLSKKHSKSSNTFSSKGKGWFSWARTSKKEKKAKVPRSTQTHLQKEIARFVLLIATLALSTAIFTIIYWAVFLRVRFPKFIDLSATLVNAIAVMVGFMPSGLPVSVTLTLTLIAHRMQVSRVLVKRLGTVEALGSVNVLASDKTGTLTMNQMRVIRVALGDMLFHAPALQGEEEKKEGEEVEAGELSFGKEVNLLMQEAETEASKPQEKSSQSKGLGELITVATLCNAASFEEMALPKASSPLSLEKGTGEKGSEIKEGSLGDDEKGKCPKDTENSEEEKAKEPWERKLMNGDATDGALLRLSEEFLFRTSQATTPTLPKRLTVDTSAVRSIDRVFLGDALGLIKVGEIPFHSKTKWMASVWCRRMVMEEGVQAWDAAGIFSPDSSFPQDITDKSAPRSSQPHYLLIKGAPDALLPRCTSILGPHGDPVTLDPAAHQWLSEGQRMLSQQGQRVLLLARRPLLPEEAYRLQEQGNDALTPIAEASGLCVVGMVGILDPPRPEIPSVVRTCRQAGVRVLMVTGDFALTAEAIARKVGILSPGGKVDGMPQVWEACQDKDAEPKDSLKDIAVLESGARGESERGLVISGSELPGLTDRAWDIVCGEEWYDAVVFARTTPEQKLRIVEEFRRRGYIVGVTGDGVNDAPALKAADIGVAMGGGSEVAMEAANMILLDNNFSSILVAMESGRLVFDNLKKVILYLLPAGSFSELIPVFTNIFLGVPLPLSAFMMVVICVVTDMAPSLALMYEKPESNLLARPPRDTKKDHLVDWRLMLQAYAFTGFMETFFSHSMFFFYLQRYGDLWPSDVLLAFDDWTDGYKGKTQEELDTLWYTGQSVTFLTLVILQAFGNLQGVRTRHLSWFQHAPNAGPSQNPALFLAMAVSLGLAAFILYLPAFHQVFKTRPVPVEFWFMPLAGAFAMWAAEEGRKWWVRRFPRGTLAKLAW